MAESGHPVARLLARIGHAELATHRLRVGVQLVNRQADESATLHVGQSVLVTDTELGGLD